MAVMRELEVLAEVDAEGHVRFDLPELSPGLHRLRIAVADAGSPAVARKLDWPEWDWTGYPPECRFSREDIYGSDDAS